MSYCPEVEYKDTGWFSWRNICRVTGEEVGNEHRQEFVDKVCRNKECDAYKDCPYYKAKHG